METAEGETGESVEEGVEAGEEVVVNDTMIEYVDLGPYPTDIPISASENVICAHCGEMHESISELFMHCKDMHIDEDDDDDEYEMHYDFAPLCATCENVFNYDSCKIHYAANYRCAVCCRIFKMKCDWQRHSWIHSANKRFACPLCDVHTNQLTNLVRHMNKHHK